MVDTPYVYKLVDWIDILKIDYWDFLSMNPRAIKFLEKNFKKINWRYLSTNKNAIELLYKNKKHINSCIYENENAEYLIKKIKIDWNFASKSPFIESIILSDKNWKQKVNWECLSQNSYAKKFLEENLDLVSWDLLSSNMSMINEIKSNLNKADWFYLSMNENAMDILEQNPDKIDIYGLCHNRNPRAIKIISENIDKLDIYHCWNILSSNPSALPILINHTDKINWYFFSQMDINDNLFVDVIKNNMHKININDLLGSPLIFEIDYQVIRDRCNIYKEELIKIVCHPSNYHKFEDLGFF